MAITHTSSHWRKTAIGSPELWQCAGFEYTPGSYEKEFSRVELLRLWLERSVPLGIYLCLTSKYTLPSSDPIDYDTVDAIASHSSRIKELSIDAHVQAVLAPILAPSEGAGLGFPALNALRLAIQQVPVINAPPTPITGFRNCQSLTKLSLNLIPPCPSILMIDWGQLTELDMHQVQRPLGRSRWMRLIRLCKKLRKGSFLLTSRADLFANGFDSALPDNAILAVPLEGPYDLDYLEELSIDYEGPDSLTSLIHNLRFKRLRKLVVRADSERNHGYLRMNLGTWTKLAQLSSLVSLTICQFDMLPEVFISLLSTMPHLQELKADLAAIPIVSSLWIDEISMWNVDDSWAPLLPKLSRLVLWVRAFSQNDCATYLGMLKSRVEWAKNHRSKEQDGEPLFHVLLFVDTTKDYASLDSLDPAHPFGLEGESLRRHIKIQHVSSYHRL